MLAGPFEENTPPRRVNDSVKYVMGASIDEWIEVDTAGYERAVRGAASSIYTEVGDYSLFFEVGMRTATCEQQHRTALRALKDLGMVRTSNVAAAREIGMVPVGTMGHEHVQRWGDDLSAFRVNPDTGALRPVPGTPARCGRQPRP